MLQEVRRDTTKEVNFRGRKVMPVVQIGHSKIDTIGYYLDDNYVPNYIVINQFDDTLVIQGSNYADAHLVNQEASRPDFSFITAMKRIEGIKPCNQLLIQKGDSKTAAEIISQVGIVKHEPLSKTYEKEILFSNCILYTMVFFTVIVATKVLVRLEQAIFKIYKLWSR